ncbi:MAG: hypothetical protein A2W80_11305 [Candidatus Riflebacteria bacterium GWC2_50_8]|nr:MAG: hypothetical protein A2W80_11305 [Candidatus Riflebacteria bacterium GWC2_50_8]
MNRVLFVSPVAFSGLQQRHQSLAAELAKNDWQVNFVDPLQTGGLSCKTEQATPNLEVVKIRVPFKGVKWPAIQTICAKFAMLLLGSKLALSRHNTLLWIAEPSLAWLSLYKWQAVVYDRCDLHGSFPGQQQLVWQKYEDILFKRATLVSCSHEYLQQSLPEHARIKSVLASNACANIFFSERLQQRPAGRPLKMVSAGAHHEWVDSGWLAMMCDHDNVELHLAGTGRGGDYENLRRLPRVINHGKLDRPELARLLKACDIGLIAFKDIELIKGVDPVKAYEYAASGLEIWAPPIKALRGNQLISKYVGNSGERNQAVADFASLPLPPPATIARWSDRLQTILDRLTVLRSD